MWGIFLGFAGLFWCFGLLAAHGLARKDEPRDTKDVPRAVAACAALLLGSGWMAVEAGVLESSIGRGSVSSSIYGGLVLGLAAGLNTGFDVLGPPRPRG